MVSMTEIKALAQRIAKLFHPEKIILFGSYAYGNPTPDSDVDLLVILNFEGYSARKAAEIRFRLNPMFALDVLVRRPEDIEERRIMGDVFVGEILEQGKGLYESQYVAVGG